MLTVEESEHFAGSVFVITAGLWPYAHPTPAVAAVLAELGDPVAAGAFTFALREGLINQLINQLIGLVARADAR